MENVKVTRASSLILWYFKFWNSAFKNEDIPRFLLEEHLEKSFGRLRETDRLRHAIPWLTDSLLKKVSSLFLNCFPLRKLIPHVVNLGFFFDRIVEYKVALRSSTIHRGDVLLDIGSAYSFFPSYLASLSYTISLDMNKDAMIFQKKASKSIGKTISQRLECVIADCTRLPFKDESLSKVFLISTIEHIDKDNIVAKESGRVLKKNGECAISIPSFSKIPREPQTRPYFQRYYTIETFRERIIIPSSLSVKKISNFCKTFVSLFYSLVPQGWFIFKDLVIGLTLSKLEEILLSRNKEGTLSVLKLRKDFERPQ